MYKAERRGSFEVLKNIFNNALEMMKSYKNESLAEEKLGFANYFDGINLNRFFGVKNQGPTVPLIFFPSFTKSRKRIALIFLVTFTC